MLKDENGNTHRIDLFVDDSYIGFENTQNMDFEEYKKYLTKSLQGRKVKIDHTWAFISIAAGVELLPK